MRFTFVRIIIRNHKTPSTFHSQKYINAGQRRHAAKLKSGKVPFGVPCLKNISSIKILIRPLISMSKL